MPDLDLRPAPGAAPPLARYVAQTAFELRVTLRNGEQLLLTLLIPLGLFLFLGGTNVVNLGPADRTTTALAGTIAVAVLSGAFTGPAISVGFERRSGALRLLGTTPLTRPQLLAAKATSILVVTLLQLAELVIAGLALGWRPSAKLLPAAGLVLLAGAAFAALGFALAGILRAEATLAVANAIFLVLLLGGGTAIPADRLPGGLSGAVGLLPSGALGAGLRSALAHQGGSLLGPTAVLCAWLVVGLVVAARSFKWD